MGRPRPKVAIVDTGSGNLRSVAKALESAGATPHVTSDPAEVIAADKIVVPGQGQFGACLAGLDRDGGALRQAVLEVARRGTPYLGLCLGLQILFDESEENPGVRGLGLLPGKVVRFQVPAPLKIPHMGWNDCHAGRAGSAALAGIADGTSFYFVHSYFAVPADAGVVALEAEHGVRFCAAVARDNLFACQFHPEKSQAAGLRLLGNFVGG